MNAHKYSLRMTPRDQIPDVGFDFNGSGDTFGELVLDVARDIDESTGAPVDRETLAEIIDTAVEAWMAMEVGLNTSGTGFRRVMGDWENDYDITITKATEVAS